MVCTEQSKAEGGSRGPGGCLGACALAGDLPCPRLSLLLMEPLFPLCAPVQKRGVAWCGCCCGGPGAVLHEMLSNALFAAVSGKLF